MLRVFSSHGVLNTLVRACLAGMFCVPYVLGQGPVSSNRFGAVVQATVSHRTVRVPLIEGNDISFRKLSNPTGLSQIRVENMVQDDQGFMWFGTQYGLDRYDGYNFKVFVPDRSRVNSLSGGYIYSLFKDRSGMLWIGCDQFLDRFDPSTETFTHYQIDSEDSNRLPTVAVHISQDRAGTLWLSTSKGMYGLDPETGRITHHYMHYPGNPASLSSNEVKQTGEDSSGQFWVCDGDYLEEFDRNTGNVTLRILVGNSVQHCRFYEDPSGELWLGFLERGGAGKFASFDRSTNVLTYYLFYNSDSGKAVSVGIHAILQEKSGALLLATMGAGLFRFDPEHGKAIRYRNDPGDLNSLPDDRIIVLVEDHEGNVWLALHAKEPTLFSPKPTSFTSVLKGNFSPYGLGENLVGAIYEDHDRFLWVGMAGVLIRIDRKTGKHTFYRPPESALNNDIVSIIQDRRGFLWLGTFGQGLYHFDPGTGRFDQYRHDPADPSSLSDDTIVQLFFDRHGVMWLATWNGLDRFDPASNNFVTYKRDVQSKAEPYFDIAEDKNGTLWLGGNSGLQHFDPATGAFAGFQHKLNDPQSLSDNRVTSVHIDHAGNIWVATHSGLDRLDPQSGTFTTYYEKDGLPSNRAHCILEDRRGDLWISTNRGISRFHPSAKTFKNYSVADGLPGMDMTGYRACFESSTGEMFFGGFSGATSFYPDRVVDNLTIPPIVFTDFRLAGHSVAVGEGSPLKKSINYTNQLTLSHQQNNFSVEFAALSYSSPTNRYRYRLDDLDIQWNEVGGDQRIVNYTSLLPGRYTFHVQAATGQSDWSASGAILYIQVLPPWWSTWWFRAAIATLSIALLWGGYQWRIEQLRRQERKLNDVIETIPTFAWSTLPDGSVDFVNRHWQEYTGLSSAKTSGSGWEAAVHPADLKGSLEKWRASLATGEPFEDEVRYRRASDGQYRRFLARAVPLRDARGHILKWYGMSTDIEDRKRAEAEREALREDLAHINRVTTMGELTASLSHEIKQPIGAAVTNADTCVRLLDRNEPDVPEAREAALEMAKDARRAAHIIDRVRSLYRKASSQIQQVDVNEAIGDMVVILHNEANRHSVTMRTDLVEGLPKVMADKVQLQQVLMNLMLNGIEAMKETGGVLTVKPQLGQDDRVLISVSDTGVGLPAENADQIFNAFFTTKPEGSGMGLAISRSIIESHGGRLWATPNDGPGATFHFTLRTQPK